LAALLLLLAVRCSTCTRAGDGAPKLNEDLRSIVIVDNIPVVDMNKYAKLCDVIRKIFSLFGTIVPDGFFVPTEGPEGAQKTAGYAFIEYATPEDAAVALAKGDQKQLDATHILRVSPYADFDHYIGMADDFVPPPKQEAHEDKTELRSWLLDPNGRDQFNLRFTTMAQRILQHQTHVFWNDPLNRPKNDCRELVYDGKRETDRGKARPRSSSPPFGSPPPARVCVC
jgi:hypothetical protein